MKYLSKIQNDFRKITDVVNIVKKYKTSGSMGLCTAIDLKNCNIEKMQDANIIHKYVSDLLKLIQMVPVGELQLRQTGKGNLAGYSFSQFVETSLLSGHFIDKTKSIYFDIFSCREYDPQKVVDFSRECFAGDVINVNVTIRP